MILPLAFCKTTDWTDNLTQVPRNKDDRTRGRSTKGKREREEEVLRRSKKEGSSFTFNHFNRKFRVGLLCAGIKKKTVEKTKGGRKVSRDPVFTSQPTNSSSTRVILPARYAGYKSHREYRLPLPSPPLPPRIDLGESEQITEFPQLREPIDKESSQEKGLAESREYIFHFFTAPSSYPRSPPSFSHLFTFFIDIEGTWSRCRKRGNEWGGGGIIHVETRDRWIAGRIIPFLSSAPSISFFFPPFFQWYFITFPMIVLENNFREHVWTSTRSY